MPQGRTPSQVHHIADLLNSADADKLGVDPNVRVSAAMLINACSVLERFGYTIMAGEETPRLLEAAGIKLEGAE